MNILMFVVLGLQLHPRELVSVFMPGMGLAAGALLIARPAAVWCSTLGMGFSWKERHFLAWAGLRGAVPIILVLNAVLSPVHPPSTMLSAVFFVVIASTLLQGLTVIPTAKRLGLVAPPMSEGGIELVSITKDDAVVLPIEVTDRSPFAHRKMVEIPFPANTLCYALVRENQVIVPRGATHVQPRDHLLVLSDNQQVDELRNLFEHELVGDPSSLS